MLPIMEGPQLLATAPRMDVLAKQACGTTDFEVDSRIFTTLAPGVGAQTVFK